MSALRFREVANPGTLYNETGETHSLRAGGARAAETDAGWNPEKDPLP
jgi:hypothetical protein